MRVKCMFMWAHLLMVSMGLQGHNERIQSLLLQTHKQSCWRLMKRMELTFSMVEEIELTSKIQLYTVLEVPDLVQRSVGWDFFVTYNLSCVFGCLRLTENFDFDSNFIMSFRLIDCKNKAKMIIYLEKRESSKYYPYYVDLMIVLFFSRYDLMHWNYVLLLLNSFE